MKFFKVLMLPLAAFVLASAAAVSTDESHKSKAEETLVMDGYIHNPTIDDCLEVKNVACELGDGAPCLQSSFTVYGFDEISGCNLTLKRTGN